MQIKEKYEFIYGKLKSLYNNILKSNEGWRKLSANEFRISSAGSPVYKMVLEKFVDLGLKGFTEELFESADKSNLAGTMEHEGFQNRLPEYIEKEKYVVYFDKEIVLSGHIDVYFRGIVQDIKTRKSMYKLDWMKYRKQVNMYAYIVDAAYYCIFAAVRNNLECEHSPLFETSNEMFEETLNEFRRAYEYIKKGKLPHVCDCENDKGFSWLCDMDTKYCSLMFNCPRWLEKHGKNVVRVPK